MADFLKISVPGKPEYVSTVRMTVSALANSAGFDIEAIEDIKVAVSEACTNVVRHGVEELNGYEVSCELGDDRLVICVIDHAGGYDVAGYKMPEPDHPKEGGLGIFIIRALMDEVDIFSEIGSGTRIQMVKYTHR
ncbi:ATP-binding protein [Bacilliculturomica massiliensis]|uniref:ATP-binding protein n=1 Tax=Bacilliculturomica massiliensis TaxID=1917867 RepID=UPI001030306E|nr:ATP-binding protein [Bacilliculturomica massiliensis]